MFDQKVHGERGTTIITNASTIMKDNLLGNITQCR